MTHGLIQNVNDCGIFLNSNYQLPKRTDRQIGTHGGALIAHKSNLVLQEVKAIDTTVLFQHAFMSSKISCSR